MIIGVGTDIIEVARIASQLEKRGDTFLNRILREEERAYVQRRTNQAITVAGLWAAKEAIAKALGSGIRFSWHNIFISHDNSGAPIVTLYDRASELAHSKNIDRIWISISHTDNNAIAFAVVEGDKK